MAFGRLLGRRRWQPSALLVVWQPTPCGGSGLACRRPLGPPQCGAGHSLLWRETHRSCPRGPRGAVGASCAVATKCHELGLNAGMLSLTSGGQASETEVSSGPGPSESPERCQHPWRARARGRLTPPLPLPAPATCPGPFPSSSKDTRHWIAAHPLHYYLVVFASAKT